MAVVPCPEDMRKPRKHKTKQLTNVNGNSTTRTGEREEVCNISGKKCTVKTSFVNLENMKQTYNPK